MERISDILMAIFANVVYIISMLFLLSMLCIAVICVLTQNNKSTELKA